MVTRYKCSIAHKWKDRRSASGSCHTWHTLVWWAWMALHKPKCGHSHLVQYIHFITQITNVQSTKGFSCVICWTRWSCQNHHTLQNYRDNPSKLCCHIKASHGVLLFCYSMKLWLGALMMEVNGPVLAAMCRFFQKRR